MGIKRLVQNVNNGIKLKTFLDKAVLDKRFFPITQPKRKTFCNQFTLIYLALLGYDIDPVLWNDGIIDNTNTFRSFTKAIENKVLQITSEEAQKRANRGEAVYILSKLDEPYNHAAIAYPTFLPYNKRKGIKVAQAGGKCGIFWISDYWAWHTRWQHSGIHYFVLEKLK